MIVNKDADMGSWREVFGYAVHPEVFFDAENLRSLLSFGLSELSADLGYVDGAYDSGASVQRSLAKLTVQALKLEARWNAAFAAVRTQEAAAEIERMIVAQSAPMASTLGAWLQGLSAPGVFEDEVHLKILALLADDVGGGEPEASRHDAFRSLARKLGLTDAIVATRDLAAVRSISDVQFCWPALVLALSRRSDAFGLELLGIDLAFRSIGVLPPWRALAGRVSAAAHAGLDLSVARSEALPERTSALELSRWIVDRHNGNSIDLARICQGIAWFASGLQHWCGHLLNHVAVRMDPRLAMGVLVQERAREAQVYHQNYKLEGKSLRAWFQEAIEDPLPVVDALGRSPLVRSSASNSSALMERLTSLDGSMFRIFSKQDLRTIQLWIESLRDGQAVARLATEHDEPLQIGAGRAPAPVRRGDRGLGLTPRSIREAYHLLQGRALPPKTRAFANDYVHKWTQAARQSIDKTDRSLPPVWSPGRLRAWLLDAHDKHSLDFKSHEKNEPPTREAIIDQTLQLAPLTLIDGAWLQGFTDIALASSRLGAPLFKTYWDELGNGQWRLNHPKIYRDVLESMGVALAPTGSWEFASDLRFRSESFRLPVYWLCVGKCPVTFRPEILGLNLAMELSGVGGSYRSAKAFLKHYGFPTAFVDLHNSIDNVSTGHAAWAADAIDAHMQAVAEHGDVTLEWQRVRTGYESLAPLTSRDSDLDYFAAESRATQDCSEKLATYHHQARYSSAEVHGV